MASLLPLWGQANDRLTRPVLAGRPRGAPRLTDVFGICAEKAVPVHRPKLKSVFGTCQDARLACKPQLSDIFGTGNEEAVPADRPALKGVFGMPAHMPLLALGTAGEEAVPVCRPHLADAFGACSGASTPVRTPRLKAVFGDCYSYAAPAQEVQTWDGLGFPMRFCDGGGAAAAWERSLQQDSLSTCSTCDTPTKTHATVDANLEQREQRFPQQRTDEATLATSRGPVKMSRLALRRGFASLSPVMTQRLPIQG